MKIDELFALLRRRGVLWPSAEIYGGAQGLYDYGPLGTRLKRNLEEAWAAWFLGLSEDYHRIEPAEILPEAVVRASGHLEHFTDPEVLCGHCHGAFRADTVLEKVRPEGIDGLDAAAIAGLVTSSGVRCPSCGATDLTVPPPFHLMFGLDLGATGKERAYLQPETAQASFLAFPRMWDVGRRTLPLGIAAIARAYRNEIAPRQVLFRMRSFTQAELEIFFDPKEFPVPFETIADEPLPILRSEDRKNGAAAPTPRTARELVDAGGLPEFFVYHLAQSFRFYHRVLGYPRNALRLYEKGPEERAFYNLIQFDIEANLPSLGGFKELGAVHYRGDYDLGRHAQGSGRDLSVVPTNRPRVLPHVLELTFGVDRNLWALADLGLAKEEERTVWHLPAYLAADPVAVFPLIRKEHGEEARRIAELLRDSGIPSVVDTSGTIGKRYARMDEMGTPWCLTVDGVTVDPGHPEHGTVTVRERDGRGQERVRIEALAGRLHPSLRFPRPGGAAPARPEPDGG
ncbi:MAG: glycine--tRNA ligase [Thermoplasmata archaeon]